MIIWSTMIKPIQLFKILADETRLAIIMLLRESGATGQSQPKISRHMAILRESELVLDRRQGKWVHYRLSPHMPAWAAEIIATTRQSMREDIDEWRKKTACATC